MISTKYAALLLSFITIAFLFGAPSGAEAASYNLTTDKESFSIGDTFTVDVKLDSSDVGVNAVQATLSFPKDTVQVTSVDKSSSAFDFWLQGPTYSNEEGQIAFIGGSQSGISGKALEVLRVVFKVKGSGSVGIIFSDGAVTASDGSGTNVLSAMNGLQLTSSTVQGTQAVKPVQILRSTVTAAALPGKPTVSVPLYPDSRAWYANISKFIVQWSLPRDVTEVTTVINQQPMFEPSVSEGLFDNKTFNPLSDGIWYLHIRYKNTVGWGTTAHYRISIDSAPPLSFSLTSSDGFSTANVAPSISFETKDQPSGVLAYKVLVNGAVATTTSFTKYTLPPLASGKQNITVQAIDYAGNMTESKASFEILEVPLITIGGIRVTQFAFYMSIILALLAGGVFGWYVGFKEKEQRSRRLIVAKRDVQTSFGIIEKDVEVLLRKLRDDAVTEQEAMEMKSILERIKGTIEKNKQYVVENIGEIET